MLFGIIENIERRLSLNRMLENLLSIYGLPPDYEIGNNELFALESGVNLFRGEFI